MTNEAPGQTLQPTALAHFDDGILLLTLSPRFWMRLIIVIPAAASGGVRREKIRCLGKRGMSIAKAYVVTRTMRGSQDVRP